MIFMFDFQAGISHEVHVGGSVATNPLRSNGESNADYELAHSADHSTRLKLGAAHPPPRLENLPCSSDGSITHSGYRRRHRSGAISSQAQLKSSDDRSARVCVSRVWAGCVVCGESSRWRKLSSNSRPARTENTFKLLNQYDEIAKPSAQFSRAVPRSKRRRRAR